MGINIGVCALVFVVLGARIPHCRRFILLPSIGWILGWCLLGVNWLGPVRFFLCLFVGMYTMKVSYAKDSTYAGRDGVWKKARLVQCVEGWWWWRKRLQWMDGMRYVGCEIY
jgi:hypothetical protein